MFNLLEDLQITAFNYYEGIVHLLPKLIGAIIVFVLFYFLANRTRNFITQVLTLRMDDPLLAAFLGRVIKIGILLMALLIALQILGWTSIATGIVTGASVSTIVIGFAFKDIGENFLAGIMLAFHRPFRVGDTVELNGYKGSVIALNLRTARIKTADGTDIFIPNANIVKNPVINYTMDGFLRYDFTIGVAYETAIPTAIEVILETMEGIAGALQDNKQTSVSISQLNPNGIELGVYFWVNTFDKTIASGDIKTAAIRQTITALQKAGIEISGNIIEVKGIGNE